MPQALTAAEEWKRYAGVAFAASVGFSFMSLMTPAAGIFMGPLSAEFGWSRTQLSIGITAAGLIGMVGSPFIGAFLDKVGARKLALPGIALTAAATAEFALTNGSVPQWIGLWTVWGLTALLIQSTTWSAAVASVFVTGRGLALGATLAGTAAAQVIVPPLTNWLITAYGWRAAFICLGVGWGGSALLLCAIFLFDAHDHRRTGPGAIIPKALLDENSAGLSLKEAWRSSELWRIAIATFLILTVTIGVLVHQFPILLEAGASRETAAWLASLAGLAGIIGKLVTGTLIDRFQARWVGGLTLASSAIAYPLLLLPSHSIPLISMAMMISGYAAGTKLQLCGYLTARYGGMRHYGAIFGFMTSTIALGGAMGPLLAGMSYDHVGSYTPLLIVATVVSVLSGGMIFSLGRYPDWKARLAEA